MTDRRTFLKLTTAGACAPFLPAVAAGDMLRRPIPGTDEMLPVIGLGTSDEFESMPADGGRELKAVLTTLADAGATLIDTAPGYGNAESVLGELLADLDLTGDMFLSTKIRTRGKAEGLRSMQRSVDELGKKPMDLIMVHSLVDADTQLENLKEWKAEGRVRHIGITTSSDRQHDEMAALIENHDLDFIQVNYSALEQNAADRVLPAARDRGVAVMVNRAFLNGRYFSLVGGKKLPAWAAEYDCDSWAQLALKYILGHDAVTSVLAATSNPRHMADNVQGGMGVVPDAAGRQRIEDLLRSL